MALECPARLRAQGDPTQSSQRGSDPSSLRAVGAPSPRRALHRPVTRERRRVSRFSPIVAALSPEKLRRSTFSTLLVGYGAYYLCRANLGVAVPLAEGRAPPRQAAARAHHVRVDAVRGVGKFTLGPTADRLGGRRVFPPRPRRVDRRQRDAIGLSTGLAVLVVVCSVNRFAQSAGCRPRPARERPGTRSATTASSMAWLSLSFLTGDVAARGFGGLVLALGFGWRAPSSSRRRSSAPRSGSWRCGHPRRAAGRSPSPPTRRPPPTAPRPPRDRARAPQEPRPDELRTLLPSSRSCAPCSCAWTILFSVELGTAGWKASFQSMLFPLTGGGAGTLFAGWYTDRRGGSRRCPAPRCSARTPSSSSGSRGSASLRRSPRSGSSRSRGSYLLGPYSLLGGCLALDYGGARRPRRRA